jgi:hypothetical protein
MLPLLAVFGASFSFRPKEMLSGEWDVFNGTANAYSTPAVGYFEFHPKLSKPSLLVSTIWTTASSKEPHAHPMLEQATITFASATGGEFTTLHDSAPIPFSFPAKGPLSLTTALGSFTVRPVSDSNIEIQAEALSLLAVRLPPVEIPGEAPEISLKLAPRVWPAVIEEFGRYKLLLIPCTMLVVGGVLAIFLCRSRPDAQAPANPKVKTE